jgi:DNA replication and repair protein RecF
MINEKNSRHYASQGQQRTAVLCLKLAEGELSMELTGEYPVFLLDDVLSELDDERKKKLLMNMPAKQVIITGCDVEIMKKLDGNLITLGK